MGQHCFDLLVKNVVKGPGSKGLTGSQRPSDVKGPFQSVHKAHPGQTSHQVTRRGQFKQHIIFISLIHIPNSFHSCRSANSFLWRLVNVHLAWKPTWEMQRSHTQAERERKKDEGEKKTSKHSEDCPASCLSHIVNSTRNMNSLPRIMMSKRANSSVTGEDLCFPSGSLCSNKAIHPLHRSNPKKLWKLAGL